MILRSVAPPVSVCLRFQGQNATSKLDVGLLPGSLDARDLLTVQWQFFFFFLI